MKTSTKLTGIAGIALSTGLLIGMGPAQAVSIIDLPQPAGNTIQVSAGQDIIYPSFALWPLPIGNVNAHTDANSAVGRGNNTTGQQWLLGSGAGNVVQIATGGNVFAPQFAAGVDNHGKTVVTGNYAAYDGNGSSTSATGGQVIGHVIDGNGNIFQLEFLQGNVIAPQVAVAGNNHQDVFTAGNGAYVVGNDSTMIAKNAGMLAWVDGNGNVVQIQILSNNVIAPQFVAGGTNDLRVQTVGNEVNGAGNGSATILSGVFAVSTTKTGNGNVTQISILSNNVWAPQFALPGRNIGHITTETNSAANSGNGSNTDLTPSGDLSGAAPDHPILDRLVGEDGHPGLDALESSQLGNGNTIQYAKSSGAISNAQNATTFVAPVQLDAPVKVTPLVRDSLVAKPGEFAEAGESGEPGKSGAAGGSGGSAPSNPKSGWKPGDGIKKVVSKISDALKPKPKPAP
jgi:hypothetical protein